MTPASSTGVQTCAAALGLLDLLTTCEGTRSQKED